MNYEMSLSFGDEQLLITLLTAIAIFIVVLVTFRSIAVPVQCPQTDLYWVKVPNSATASSTVIVPIPTP